jgi:hypothetical protein
MFQTRIPNTTAEAQKKGRQFSQAVTLAEDFLITDRNAGTLKEYGDVLWTVLYMFYFYIQPRGKFSLRGPAWWKG